MRKKKNIFIEFRTRDPVSCIAVVAAATWSAGFEVLPTYPLGGGGGEGAIEDASYHVEDASYVKDVSSYVQDASSYIRIY